jgi:hypothetical protein
VLSASAAATNLGDTVLGIKGRIAFEAPRPKC